MQQGCQSSAFRRNSAFFRAFRFFSDDFPLFLKKSPEEKNTVLRHRNYWESSKSFGKQSLTSSFAGLRFFRFRSKFESVASTLGMIAGCRLTKALVSQLTVVLISDLLLAASRGRRGGWCLSGGMGDGLKRSHEH